MSDGNRVKIPLKAMALESLEQLFPALTAEQCAALRAGGPVPPSPDFVAGVPAPPPADGGHDVLLDRFVAAACRGMPKVAAILVVADPRRVGWARRAVNQFVRQSYPNKQLVVVNAAGTPVTTVPHHEIVETAWPAGATPHELRGVGAGLAAADLLFPHWDDDDLFDRHLLAFMAAHYTPRRPVMLGAQVRVDIVDSAVTLYANANGIPETLLVPAGGVTFQKAGFAFDSPDGVTVVDTLAWPASTLHVRVFTGENATPRDAFMRGSAPGRWAVEAKAAEHVCRVFAGLGFKITPGV